MQVLALSKVASLVPVPAFAVSLPEAASMESLQALILRGGPLMIPIGVCSLVAVAFSIERWIGLRTGNLGGKRLGNEILDAAKERGARAALDVCVQHDDKPLARIVASALERVDSDFAEREKVVEDTAHSEVTRLARNLRPLFLVWLVAPLLGLLGTVWGMIEAFGDIAVEAGLGRPEVLAGGIYRALTTTAAGLVVAIPAICAYWYLQGRIEAFASRAENVHRAVEGAIRPRAPRAVPQAASDSEAAAAPARASASV